MPFSRDWCNAAAMIRRVLDITTQGLFVSVLTEVGPCDVIVTTVW